MARDLRDHVGRQLGREDLAQEALARLNSVQSQVVGLKSQVDQLLTAISGTSQAVPAEERDYVQPIRDAGDAGTKIAIYASAMRAIAGRLAPVLSIIQQAALAEPELAVLWTEIAQRRAANMRRFVADLAAVAQLRVDPGDAADIVWATNAPELYQLLVSQQGWSPERYEHFLADAWRRLLLAGQPD